MRFRTYNMLILLFVLLCAGCSGVPGSFSYDPEGKDYFFGEFQDIPIPKEMNSCTETTIITTPNNIITGVQVYKGRVEVTSLVKVMQSYMRGSGWQLRSSTRSAKSLLLFEKTDKFCIVYMIDGTFFTEMQVFVTPKLQGGGQPVVSGTAPEMVLPKVEAANPGDESGAAPASNFDSHTLSD